MAHQCWKPLFWPPWIILYQLFVATIIPSLVTVIWIVWMSGPTCTKTGSPHCLGIWYAMLMPCVNYWACAMVHMYLFYPLMKREILLTTFVWIEILRLFIMYHPVDIWHFYFSLSTSLHCDSMCFYQVIYPYAYVIVIYVFYCAIFTCKLCANKDILYVTMKLG